MLTAGDSVVTLGSCFARELRDLLSQAGLRERQRSDPGGAEQHLCDARLRLVVRDRLRDRRAASATTGSRTARSGSGSPRRSARATDALAEAGAFVFTIGLAEVWQDRETGGVFWRGIPEEIFDADRHVFRLTTVEENAANILEIVELVRPVNPTAPIVVTLSPVPLEATFRGHLLHDRGLRSRSRCCGSRSTRSMAAHRPDVYYWPSFEVVRWAGAHLRWPAYGVPRRRRGTSPATSSPRSSTRSSRRSTCRTRSR